MLQRSQDQLALGLSNSGLTDRKYQFFRPQSGTADVRRQGVFFNPFSLREHYRSFGDIAQLANVARPGIRSEHGHRLVGSAHNLQPVLHVELVDEMLDE